MNITDLKKYTSDKVSKEELLSMLPNEELAAEKTRFVVREEVETVQKQITEQIKLWDSKLIRIRNELDIHSI